MTSTNAWRLLGWSGVLLESCLALVLLWATLLHAFSWRVEMQGDVLGEFLKKLSSIPECAFVYS